ncbi:RNA polymerase sigma-54 factor [bacterium (candidate division B38) B3_B38]|nr:MAG: RNA polymerase sigma-54 factor [bacterium (candidate division B38) B3_B38]
MELKQKLVPKLTQRLVMTPSLQLAIKLLQLPRIELENVLQQELEKNPLLEELSQELTPAEESPPEEDRGEVSKEKEAEIDLSEPFGEVNLEDFFQNYQEHGSIRPYDNRPELPSFESTLSKPSTLSDYLLWQLRLSTSSKKILEIGSAIIGNIDEDGYLRASVEEISRMGDFTSEEVEEALRFVQSLDPVGIGARDLKECLFLQLKSLELEETIADLIVKEHLHLLQGNQLNKLAKIFNRSLEEIKRGVEVIRSLEPKPGRKYSTGDTAYVVPDVFVVKRDGEYEVILNEDGLPQLRISPLYRRMLSPSAGAPPEVVEYIRGKFRSALWLIKSYNQRQRTIYKVAKSIVECQTEFLDKGVDELKPMVLSDVAEDIGMHESTVSRVVSNKYMQTPQGLFLMKYFFHSKLNNIFGEEVSSIKIKQKIKRFIEAEDSHKPLSDCKISEMLRAEGVNIARRTVAKYREHLRIPASKFRKAIS